MTGTSERLLAGLPEGAGPPRKNGELVFEAPWQARVFGLAAALHEEQAYDRDAFRQRLVAALGACEVTVDPADYYERWLASLETLLLDKGLLTLTEIEARLTELAAGEH